MARIMQRKTRQEFSEATWTAKVAERFIQDRLGNETILLEEELMLMNQNSWQPHFCYRASPIAAFCVHSVAAGKQYPFRDDEFFYSEELRDFILWQAAEIILSTDVKVTKVIDRRPNDAFPEIPELGAPLAWCLMITKTPFHGARHHAFAPTHTDPIETKVDIAFPVIPDESSPRPPPASLARRYLRNSRKRRAAVGTSQVKVFQWQQ
ncbi:hypothetical protein T439DRAFT_334079 [Meredithblackwellia eburnea MCA 4105]